MSSWAEDMQELADPGRISENPFKALATVASYFNSGNDAGGRELLYRLMENKESIPSGMLPVLNSLVEAAGLYPYLEARTMTSTADKLLYESHRPEGAERTVLHAGQLEAYISLMNGENVVLSAPTSFGKSLLIDVMIATGKFDNVVVIVPTIALIDETRRRLQRRFGSAYKVITHASQQNGRKNIYVLTQERFLELNSCPRVDFFVIDEFYKLMPTEEDGYDARTISLNVAFLKLLQARVQFLLIGPNIEKVDFGDNEIKFKFIKSDFKTVGSEVVRVNSNGDEASACFRICRSCKDPTLIFCGSIAKVYKLAGYLVDHGLSAPSERSVALARWVAENYSSEWGLVRFLLNGIAIHHSSLPRSLAQYLLHLFNEGDIRYLICTSTIIEGVNTSARNIIVYDNKIAGRKYDYFTFCNIKGRAGRMFRHWIGRIFVLNKEPQEELQLVEIPALTLPEGTPLELAMEVDDGSISRLSDADQERLRYLHAQEFLPVEVIRANAPIDAEAQLTLAKRIHKNLTGAAAKLVWEQMPNSTQLKSLCWVVFDVLHKGKRSFGVSSWRQLFVKLIQVQNVMPNGFRTYLEYVRRHDKKAGDADAAIQSCLMFLRNWMEFQLPRSIMAVNRIQRSVFSSHGISPGDYSQYVDQVKHWFRQPAELILEEYGVPMPVTEKFGKMVPLPTDVDGAVEFMNNANAIDVNASFIEKDMLDFAFAKNEDIL